VQHGGAGGGGEGGEHRGGLAWVGCTRDLTAKLGKEKKTFFRRMGEEESKSNKKRRGRGSPKNSEVCM